MNLSISDTVTRKFVDSLEVSGWEIETESGWVDITAINKTVEYDVWVLETESGKKIECADNHIVFTSDGEECFAKNLREGDLIKGKKSIECIKSITLTDRKEHMYDLSVGGNHTYFAEGILHHNTTTAAAYFVWYIIFNKRKSVAIVANKQATADEIFRRIRTAYENLPKWLQVGVHKFNLRSISLENGTHIFCSATASTGLRGQTVNILYLDEIAFVQNTQAEDFFTSVYPTITASTESKVIMTSTPNGFNHFWKFWNDAKNNTNGFVPIRCYWNEMPGRDEKWYKMQSAALGELKAAQEIDAEFIGSSRQLLTSQTMKSLSPIPPIQIYTGEYRGLNLYANPVPGRSYIMTVDVSRGRHLDASAFTIFDVTEYPHRIVATYNNNEIAPLMYAAVIWKLHKNYNSAYILIEINDIGAQVADELYYTYEVEEMFWTKTGDQLGKTGSDPYPGIRTTKKTKRIGCANLKDIIEKQQVIIDDETCIKELSTFVQSDAGVWEADEGFHDDQVATLWLFAWLVTQPWFVDLTNKNMRNQMYLQKIKEIDEFLTPFGFIVDGLGEHEEETMIL